MHQNLRSNLTLKWRPVGLSTTHRNTTVVSSPAFLASRLPVGFFTLLLLTSLALLAFLLQFTDPTIRLQHGNDGPAAFAGLAFSEPESSSPSSVNCAGVLGQSDKVSFPYYREWKFGLRSDLGPKVGNFYFYFFKFCFVVIDLNRFLTILVGFFFFLGFC